MNKRILQRSRLSLAVALAFTAGAHAQSLPTDGRVTAGSASVSNPSASAMVVTQTTDKLAMTWQSFSIGAGHSVQFAQPSAASIALNRVIGGSRSEIYGSLSANGQVFLVNPNGILFGAGAQVDVGGLVASTLNITDRDFLDGKYVFSDPANRNSVVNEGTLNGRYVALIGHHAINRGTIHADRGAAALGGGSTVQLTLAENKLVSFQVEQSALDALAENRGLIRADGGRVILTAGARDSLLASAVNNTGVIEARTVQSEAGNILLLAGMEAGTTHVGGTLDASAPNGGDGGFIETSGAHVKVTRGARITTAAPQGKTGKWLIDPQDFAIAGGGGDITGTDLTNALASSNVEIQSSSGGSPGSGDINVNDDVNWNANTLTLTAARDINIGASMVATGTSSLVMNTGTANGGDAGIPGGTVKFPVDLLGMGFPGQIIFDRSGTGFLTINGLPYTVIRDVNELQAMSGNTAGRYALGAQIDASATSTWNGGLGFAPVGFSGVFDGLGHTITGLTIDRPSATQVGLFGSANGATLRNVALAGGQVAGGGDVGALVGIGTGNTLHNILSSTPITGGFAGGLAGTLVGSTVTDVHVTGSVSKPSGNGNERGGLIGTSESNILTRVSAAGDLIGIGSNTGGLIGSSSLDIITDASASGNLLEAGLRQGGLIGVAQGTTIADSHATGNVGGTGTATNSRGGLVGEMLGGSITDSYAAGSVQGQSDVGGLAGLNTAAISGSYATGIVSGTQDRIGGLIGNNSGVLMDVRAEGASSVSGRDQVGGLIGTNTGALTNVRAEGNVSGRNRVGGLVGGNTAAISGARAGGLLKTVTATEDYVGGLVGYNDGGAITGTSADRVTAQSNVSGAQSWVGGAVGYNQNANLTYVSASGSATSTATASPDGRFVGGLVGELKGGTIDHGTASGSVQGQQIVGGLVGQLSTPAGPMQNNLFFSTASGSVTVTAASGVGRAGGLVGVVSSAQAIQDVEATIGSNVFGGNTSLIGGLIGDLGSGTPLVRAVARGAVSGSQIVGGLVGRNVFSTITDSHAHGNVTATAGGDAGGLVGQNGSDVMRSYAEGTVTAVAGNRVGGLIGSHDTGTLTEVHAIGKATGASDVGGLVGNSSGNIIDSYATGGATATASNAGGLAGTSGAFVERSRASGTVTGGTSNTGGLIGHNQGAVGDSYATAAVIGNGSNTGGLIGSSTGTLTLPTSGVTLSGVHAGGTVTSTGANTGGLIGHNTSSVSDAYATATVTGTSNTGGLIGSNAGSVAASYYDTGTVAGSGSNTGGLIGSNTSTLTLSGVRSGGTVISTGANTGGLIGFNTANVSDSHSTAAVTGASLVGGLIGYVSGSGQTISRVYATGNVTGNSATGGLIGEVASSGSVVTVSDAYAIGPVTGGDYTGGLIGRMRPVTLATRVFATGAVTGDTVTGGLVGGNEGGILDAYATGAVTGTGAAPQVGGVVGDNAFGASVQRVYAAAPVTNNGTPTAGDTTGGVIGQDASGLVGSYYWDGSASANQVFDIGNTATTFGRLNATQAKTQSSYAGFDFTGTWVIYDGHTYPLLRTFMTPLTVTAGNAAKTYDGATFSGGNGVLYSPASPAPNAADLLGTLSYGGNSQGARNAGTYAIKAEGLYSHQHGYAITFVDGTLTVAQAPLTLSTSDVTKTYDGNTTAAGTAIVTGGTLFGDSISGGTFAFDIKDAGIGNKVVTVSGVAISDGNGGNNYAVTYANNTTSTINRATVTASGVTANDKVYDGTAVATIDTSAAGALSGILGTDNVSLSPTGLTASFDNKHVGTGKVVSLSGVTLSGADAGNYQLASVAPVTASITPASLTVSTSDVTKTYDGTNSAAGTLVAIGGTLFSGDSLTGGAFHFDNKNAGTGKTVIVDTAGVSDGNSGGNYIVTRVDNTSSTINRANLVLSTSDVTKTYDSNTTAAGTAVVAGGTLFTGDSIASGTGTFVFDTRNAGTGKRVSVSGVTLDDGASGGNYNVSYVDNTTSTITPKALTVSGITADSKVYDGSDVATLSIAGASYVGLVSGDSVNLNVTGLFDTRNVGSGKTVALSSTYGGDAGNYAITSQASTIADITPKALTVSGITASNKVYDGTDAAVVNIAGVSYAGLVTGDSVALNVTGTFDTKNVGNGKTVALSSTYGADAGNYSIASQMTSSADITPAALTVRASDITKTVDTAYSFAGTEFTATGLATGETIGGVLLSSPGAASGATIAGGPYAITASGATGGSFSLSNYNVTYVDGAMTVVAPPPPVASATPTAVTVIDERVPAAILTAQQTAPKIAGAREASGGIRFTLIDAGINLPQGVE